MIPYGRQSIDQADIEAVVSVLKSEFLTQGPAVPAFEGAIEAHCDVQHAIAASSATAALHVACLALGVGPGDIVWTSPVTFVASANCALYCGATVDFVDIDPRTYNMSVDDLTRKLEIAERVGQLPKVLIPVHLAGQSCNMAEIAILAKRFGFRVVEDASHAIGGRYAGGPVGNCRYSDVTVFSFHPVKIITTGEGGMITTNNTRIAERIRLLCSHGITRDPELMEKDGESLWYYEQIYLGYNYRMTDLQAALGSSQLTKLKSFVSRRRELAARYDRMLGASPLMLPWQLPETESSYHLYIIRIDASRGGRAHRQAFDLLRNRGIGVNLHYIPVYLQPFYRRLGFRAGLCPEAERYYSEAISIPIYAALQDRQQDRIVATLNDVLEL